MKDFISRCLNRNANQRFNAAELLRHKWFKKLVIDHEIPEDELIDTGLNLYTFKQSSLFQSSVIAFLVG